MPEKKGMRWEFVFLSENFGFPVEIIEKMRYNKCVEF